MFFISIEYNGRSTIPLDHMTTVIRGWLDTNHRFWVLGLMIAGAILPFVKKSWNKSALDIVFTIFKILGVILGVMYIWGLGPAELHQNRDLFPFLFNTLCSSLAVLIPLGALFLSFLTNYGLMEFCGVFMQPFMRRFMKMPGRFAIDAVASLVGSYSLAILITDKLYQEGKYTRKEAAIIITGLSTVSVTFLVVVARTLDLMEMWNFYFWSVMAITLLITAITTRIFPLSRVPDEYCEGATPTPEQPIRKDRFEFALGEALRVAENSGSIPMNVLASAKAGMRMICTILPTIMSIGLVGMLIALYTPVFDMIGYIFYPFALLVQLGPEALLVAQALATGIAEMFLPAAFVVEASLQARYVVAVSCVTPIIFFSAVVPCILATKIPVKISQLLIIWVERLILSILLSGIVAMTSF